MSTVRLRSMTMALRVPPSWPILTRRSTTVSDGETVKRSVTVREPIGARKAADLYVSHDGRLASPDGALTIVMRFGLQR
jgi:hypothetical protein